MRTGERPNDQKAGPNNANLIPDRGSPLSTCRGHPILSLLRRGTKKRVLTPEEQDSKVDQWDRLCLGVTGCDPTGALISEDNPTEDSKGEGKENHGDKTQGQQPPQRAAASGTTQTPRESYATKPQDGKEKQAGDPPTEDSAAYAE